MSLETPTTQEVSDNIIAQLESALNQTIPLLPKSFFRVLAKVLSGVFIILYKYAGFTFLQVFVRTASISTTEINGAAVQPLIEWGRLVGVGDPAAATNAELLVDITVTSQVGSLPSNTQLVGVDNGVTYMTIGSVLLNAATVSAVVKAVSDQSDGGGAGAIGNLNPGSIVSFANPLGNVNRDTVVTSQTVTGADGESTEAYRQRILDRFQKKPQGGALADYEIWAEEPAGILRAYPYTSDCPGQVDVYIEATVESSGSPDGIPTPAQLQESLDSINFDPITGVPNRRPANALANTFPITRSEFDVEVSGLQVTNPAEVQQDIIDAVTEYFLAREPFIDGLSITPRRDQVTVSAVAGVVEDVVSAAGGIFSIVTMTLLSFPVITISLGIGQKAKAGSITFV